jgi:hypothetical protein
MNSGHAPNQNNFSNQQQGQQVDNYSNDQNNSQGHTSKISTLFDDSAREIEQECMRLGISLEEWNDREEKKFSGGGSFFN